MNRCSTDAPEQASSLLVQGSLMGGAAAGEARGGAKGGALARGLRKITPTVPSAAAGPAAPMQVPAALAAAAAGPARDAAQVQLRRAFLDAYSSPEAKARPRTAGLPAPSARPAPDVGRALPCHATQTRVPGRLAAPRRPGRMRLSPDNFSLQC